MVLIKTKRLLLRQFIKNDAKEAHELFADLCKTYCSHFFFMVI